MITKEERTFSKIKVGHGTNAGTWRTRDQKQRWENVEIKTGDYIEKEREITNDSKYGNHLSLPLYVVAFSTSTLRQPLDH